MPAVATATRRLTARTIAPGLLPSPLPALCKLPVPVSRQLTRRHAPPLPATVDLSDADPPVADEGSVHAGAAWATAYTLAGWWENRYQAPDGPFAPMSVYALVSGGKNRPVTLADVLATERRQGIDTQLDYRHSPTDYRHRPTRAELASAAQHRIAGYNCVYARRHSSFSAETVVKAMLAGGQPVVLAVPVFDNLIAASARVPFVDLPARGARLRGAEAVVAVKYDGNGVWVQNQWGAGWGLSGYAELSWRFVDRYVSEIWTLRLTPPRTNAPLAPIFAPPALTGTPAVPISTTYPYTLPTINGTTIPMSACTALTPGPDTGVATGDTPTPTATAVPTLPPTAPITDASALATACAGVTLPYSSYPSDLNVYPSYGTPYPTPDMSSYAQAYPTYQYPSDFGSYVYPTVDPAFLTAIAATATLTTTATPTLTHTATPSPTPQPTSTATATPTPLPATVSVAPSSGAAGTSITVQGHNFGTGGVFVYLNAGSNSTAIGFAPTNPTDSNSFTVTVAIPATAQPGPATIYCANPATGVYQSAAFTVQPPPTATNTSVPTATSTPTSTNTPVATATSTATSLPTSTATTQPTATATPS